MSIDERYIPLLMEECAEVIQACSKILRFGRYDEFQGKTNIECLMREIGDVLTIMDKVGAIKSHTVDTQYGWIDDAITEKNQKLKIYGPDGSYIKSTKTDREEISQLISGARKTLKQLD